MSSDTVNTPRPRRLVFAGIVGVVVAGAVAAHGIIQRANSAQQVARWTDQQAIPTVNLAKVTAGQEQTLTLPGTIQAFRKAAIYARVSGYLKSWQTDIGSHVQPGQVLAVIDTPDLDQSSRRPKPPWPAPRPMRRRPHSTHTEPVFWRRSKSRHSNRPTMRPVTRPRRRRSPTPLRPTCDN
jgi:hypothetical protein